MDVAKVIGLELFDRISKEVSRRELEIICDSMKLLSQRAISINASKSINIENTVSKLNEVNSIMAKPKTKPAKKVVELPEEGSGADLLRQRLEASLKEYDDTYVIQAPTTMSKAIPAPGATPKMAFDKQFVFKTYRFMGNEEFVFKGIRFGKRSNLIFMFEPFDKSEEFSHVEIEGKNIGTVFPRFARIAIESLFVRKTTEVDEYGEEIVQEDFEGYAERLKVDKDVILGFEDTLDVEAAYTLVRDACEERIGAAHKRRAEEIEQERLAQYRADERFGSWG